MARTKNTNDISKMSYTKQDVLDAIEMARNTNYSDEWILSLLKTNI